MNGGAEARADRPGRPSFFLVTLVVVCVGLAVIDVGLVLQNRELGERLRQLTRRALAAERSVLADGQAFPSVTLLDPSGAALGFPAQEDDRAALLLLSSTACDYCDDVRSGWDEVSRLAAGSGLQVLELVVDAVPQELAMPDRPHPLFAPGADARALVRRLPGIPAAILVDAGGTVYRSFYGADQTGLQGAVEQLVLGESSEPGQVRR